MKQQGNCIVGDNNSVISFTQDWYTVRLHPTTFYRRLDRFHNGFDKVSGLYTLLDLGQYVLVRFSEHDDLTEFHRMHHEYI